MIKKLLLLALMGISLPIYAANFSQGKDFFDQALYSQAFDEFKPLADKGARDSQYYVAYLYLNGLGIGKDEQKGLKYLRQSADQNYEKAQTLLGYMYSEGILLPKDKKKALDLYNTAAENGDDDALLNLGVMYYTGDTVEKDVEKAISYLEEIDVSSRPIAYRYLGDIYQNQGTPESFQKARIYYEYAASHDDIDAFHSLAYLLHQEKEVETAFQYYTYTASLGNPLSQYMLGTIYANGELGKRDIIKAYAWFSLAAQQGLDIAIAAQKQLNKNMTLSDVQKSHEEIINIKNTITGKIQSPLKDKISAQKNVQSIAASPHKNRKPRGGRGKRSR